jgi:hypothetical protein
VVRISIHLVAHHRNVDVVAPARFMVAADEGASRFLRL